MKLERSGFCIDFIKEQNTMVFSGILRSESIEWYDELMNFIYSCSLQSSDDIILDFIHLENINSSGIATLSLYFIKIKNLKKRIKIIASNNIPWQRSSLEDFKLINNNIEIEAMSYH